MYNNLAPLIIFAYNRYDHIESTIYHLLKNKLASETELYIYSDAPKSDKDTVSVQKVRKVLHQISGFKNILIVEREKNYGLAKNIIEGVTEVIEKYGKIIVLEDDLLTSENFLCYMNESLEYYKDRKDIFSVSGYTGKLPSLSKYNNDTYLAYRPSSWGWATWKDQWNNIDWNVEDFEEFIKNKKAVKRFNRGGIDMTRMLKHYMKGKNNSWAIRWSYAMHKQNKYSVYPKVSKIQNIGFGEDATHCSGVNIYQTILDKTSKCNFNFTDEIIPNIQIAEEFKYQYSYTNKLIKKTAAIVRNLKNEA